MRTSWIWFWGTNFRDASLPRWTGQQMARIVIVEDETQVLMMAESVLQQAGYETCTPAPSPKCRPSSIQGRKVQSSVH
jgi:hypothetical protein